VEVNHSAREVHGSLLRRPISSIGATICLGVMICLLFSVGPWILVETVRSLWRLVVFRRVTGLSKRVDLSPCMFRRDMEPHCI
jgi:hypothetical protein